MRRALALGLAGFALLGLAPAPIAADWRTLELKAGGRVLLAALPFDQRPGSVLTVVVEGDGRAHRADGSPSRDPTPRRPVGLSIARAWPKGPVAWLGRLCQGTRKADPACKPDDWTRARFSDTALTAASSAIDQLKDRAGADRIVLVGWSGGGTLAALLANRRADVASLVTIAAPLDLEAWTRLHGLSPLDGRDPAREPPPTIPQAHVFGARDKVTPQEYGRQAARRQGGVAVVMDEAHDCCWAARATRLAELATSAP